MKGVTVLSILRPSDPFISRYIISVENKRSIALIRHFVYGGSADVLCARRPNATGKSGYKTPLKREVRTAEAIVIARVLSEHRLQDEADDAEGTAASNVTVKVLKKLKGTLSGVIVLRNANTSSRYPMSVGAEHILFVSRTNHEMWIDSCGNSDVMPDGDQVARKVREQRRAMK